MSLARKVEQIEERIARACERSGRKRDELTLMAVSKFQPASAVEEAWNAGLRCFGESRVQEATAKLAGFKEARPGASLHLIGALQSNKAKTAAAFFDCVQSIDRESIARDLARHREPLSSTGAFPVMLELRTGEDTKTGFADLDSLLRTAEFVFSCPALAPLGLMTMAPFTDEEAPIRAAFRKLRQAQSELARRFPRDGAWECLSMGMSNDFEIAVEEGSTLLRIGTAIFGG